MDAFEAERTVLAVREFRDEPPPEETIRRIVEAVRLPASSTNGQPRHFVVIDDREMLRRVGTLAPSEPYMARAPMAVVVAIEVMPHAVSDASRAIRSMVLAAWSAGVGSNRVGVHRLGQVKAPHGIPDRLDVPAIVPFGHPATRAPRARSRAKRSASPAPEIATARPSVGTCPVKRRSLSGRDIEASRHHRGGAPHLPPRGRA